MSYEKNLKDIFTKKYLNNLESISKVYKNKVPPSSGYGTKSTNLKGNSMEFSDFRDYATGDDLRLVDWNSFARFQKMYVKLFVAEVKGSINLFLDCSNSMGSVSKEKFIYAKSLVASIAYMSMCNGDNVNIFLWSSKIVGEKLNISRKNQFMELINWLQDIECNGETVPVKSFLYTPNLKKGLSFVVSDFLSEIAIKEMISLLQSKNQDVILIQTLSKEEVLPESVDNLRMMDSENGEFLDVEVNESIINGYVKALETYQNSIREICFTRGSSFIFLRTDEDIFTGIRRVFTT